MREEPNERDLLVFEVMALAYTVDRQTKYCVFIDYSGHVESLCIEICESKENYSEKLVSTDFYVTGKFEPSDNLGWLKSKRDHLKSIIEENDISAEGMEEIITQTVKYAF